MTSHPDPISRQRMMREMVAKHAVIILVFLALYRPLNDRLMAGMPLGAQGSVIELLGFLMAAAIIGAFELNYSRTNLSDDLQRYLAHFTKFTLYSSILLHDGRCGEGHAAQRRRARRHHDHGRDAHRDRPRRL